MRSQQKTFYEKTFCELAYLFVDGLWAWMV